MARIPVMEIMKQHPYVQDCSRKTPGYTIVLKEGYIYRHRHPGFHCQSLDSFFKNIKFVSTLEQHEDFLKRESSLEEQRLKNAERNKRRHEVMINPDLDGLYVSPSFLQNDSARVFPITIGLFLSHSYSAEALSEIVSRAIEGLVSRKAEIDRRIEFLAGLDLDDVMMKYADTREQLTRYVSDGVLPSFIKQEC